MIPLCSLWSTENVQWKNANWTWAECEMVQEICQIWSTTQFSWKNANWKWSECSSSIPPIPPIPVVTVGNPPGVDAETLVQPWQLEEPWNPYKESTDNRKRLIKLICKVQGKEYIEEREAKDFPITVRDIKAVVKAVSNIDLNFRME